MSNKGLTVPIIVDFERIEKATKQLRREKALNEELTKTIEAGQLSVEQFNQLVTGGRYV